MDITEVAEIIQCGEDSRHQFKRDINNPEQLAAEFAAFCNTNGGVLLIGVDDNGTITGLQSEDVRRLNQMISNVASQGLNPSINVETENINMPQGIVLAVTVPNGLSKPYMDKNGIIWVKNGSDKRKATSREEIQRIFQREGIIHADETEVSGTTIGDLDLEYFSKFFEKQYERTLGDEELPLEELLENMNLTHEGKLTLAGALLFAKNMEFRLPHFSIKSVIYNGTNDFENEYIDKRQFTGTLSKQFHSATPFILSNLPNEQAGQNFNSKAQCRIPRNAIEELLTNALLHRDYFVPASIRIFMFKDRLEIISPGHLTNNLTVENIKAGNSVSRNPILTSYAPNILPYSGIGTGIRRALNLYPKIEFYDDREGNKFTVVIRY